MAIQIRGAPQIGWYFPLNPLYVPYFWTGRTRTRGFRVEGLVIAILKQPTVACASPTWLPPDQIQRLGNTTIFTLTAVPPDTWRGQDISAALQRAATLATSAMV